MSEVTEKYTYEEAEDMVQKFLDEMYPPVKVVGIKFNAGAILRELDPIAFRETVLDVIDAEGWEVEEFA